MLKRCLLTIILPFTLCCSQLFAADLLNDSVASQSMQTADSQDLPAPTKQPAASQSVTGGQEKSNENQDGSVSSAAPASQAAAAASQDASTDTSAATSPAPIKGITLSPKAVMTLQASREIEAQLNTVNNQMAQYQKQNDQRVSTVQGQVLVLQSQVTSLNKAAAMLNQDLLALRNQLGQQSASAVASGQSSFWRALIIHVEDHILIYSLATLLLVLLLYFFVFSARKRPLQQAATSSQSNQEYDFLGSPEGVAAKLDLARAYLAMQDYTQMRSILEEIMHKGDAEQKREAQSLMNNIPAES